MSTAPPYGRWPSPLTAEAAAALRGSRSGLSSDGSRLYWLESRPEEGGRQVLVRARPGGETEVASPPGVSVRSRVHEYGGGAYCLVGGDGGDPAVAYVDQADQRIQLWTPGGAPAGPSPTRAPHPVPHPPAPHPVPHPPAPHPPAPVPVALGAEPPPGERWYHGDLRATPDGRWVLAVRERHRDGGVVTREVVAVGVAAPGSEATLCAGRDFFAAPRPDGSGRWLAWICWDHPDMPWDASEIWVGALGGDPDGRPALAGARRVAGGADPGREGGGESVGQPLWCRDGSLVFVSDAGGWWQPWRWSPGGAAERISSEEAEFHAPDWQLGQASMVELPGGALFCRRRRDGMDAVGVLYPETGRFAPLPQPCVSVGGVCLHGDGAGVAWLGSSSELATAPWWCPDPEAGGGPPGAAPAVAAGEPVLAAADVSVGRHFSLTGSSGRTVHGLYFAPALGGVPGPEGARPPLIVACHGGPTGCAEAGFDPVVQLFTTRGYAVAAIDYAGSTGYGRAYRRSLRGSWGIADAEDCADAAAYLAAQGCIDGRRMAIRGSSAGGFTALCALARSEVFSAAVSWYGVTDLLALAAATHDFEAHYCDGLVGPLPEAADEHRRRSPVSLVEEVHGAVLVLQGLDDPVVPPAQAEAMVAALRRRGVPCRCLVFPGEGHGFRRAETLAASFEAELAFYAEHLAPDDHPTHRRPSRPRRPSLPDSD